MATPDSKDMNCKVRIELSGWGWVVSCIVRLSRIIRRPVLFSGHGVKTRGRILKLIIQLLQI